MYYLFTMYYLYLRLFKNLNIWRMHTSVTYYKCQKMNADKFINQDLKNRFFVKGHKNNQRVLCSRFPTEIS